MDGSVIDKVPRLFLWRGRYHFGRADGTEPELPALYASHNYQCPFCGASYAIYSPDHYAWPSDSPEGSTRSFHECTRCGFLYFYCLTALPFEPGIDCIDIWPATLRSMSINDADLGMAELGSHLRRRISDIYSLAPNRFVELVGDVYQSLGYSVRYQPQTWDDGYDLVLLEKNSEEHILVQCKRWAATRTVGIAVARELLGVLLLEGAREGWIATTSHFSPTVRETVRKSEHLPRAVGEDTELRLKLRLIDIEEIGRSLQVYNTNLPPLSLEARIVGQE
jgi:Restriction endonuclease